MAPNSAPRILACGDSALTIEFGDKVDEALSAAVLALDASLAAEPIAGIVETVPTYRSLLVHFDVDKIDGEALAQLLIERAGQSGGEIGPRRHWRVPVVYGGEYGIDLENVARHAGLSPDDLIARHAAATYRVYMVGFTPGFTYLGGLDQSIAMPRLDEPRLTTPAGTISIGGVQAAIQCLAGPSGWHLLGRTPVRTFHATRDPVFLIEPGDSVSFYKIDESDWDELDKAAAAGEPVAQVVPV